MIASLGPDARKAGITAVSAGNHAIAAAWAARKAGISAKVVMTGSANPLRVAAARAEGAEVIMAKDVADAFATVERLRSEEGRSFVHPFEGPETTLGAAGVGLELMEDAPDLDAVIVSVGGGGLISGIGAAVKAMRPETMLYAVEPEGAPSLTRSFAAGAPVKLDAVSTIADSLAPPFALPYSFALCRAFTDHAVTLSDDQIAAGVAMGQEELKLALEPAAGAVLAGAMGPLRERLQGKRVGFVICGANIDAGTFAGVLARGAAARD